MKILNVKTAIIAGVLTLAGGGFVLAQYTAPEVVLEPSPQVIASQGEVISAEVVESPSPSPIITKPTPIPSPIPTIKPPPSAVPEAVLAELARLNRERIIDPSSGPRVQRTPDLPRPDLCFTPPNQTITHNEITFDASCTKPVADDPIVSYTWKFREDQTVEKQGMIVKYTFSTLANTFTSGDCSGSAGKGFEAEMMVKTQKGVTSSLIHHYCPSGDY